MKYDAVIFDLLTALIDSWTLWNDVAGSPDAGMKWRRRYLEITYGCGPYRPYETLVREAARDLGLPDSLGDRLERRWGELKPWPEARGVLTRIPVPLAVATNCSVRLGRQAADCVGVPFKVLVTAESAGFYKPRPEPYRAVLKALGTAPERTLFVAGSASDVPGAHAGLLAQSHRASATRRRPPRSSRNDTRRAGRFVSPTLIRGLWCRRKRRKHVAETAPFRPEEHRFGPTHWFEDLEVGQKFYINSRTQTESMFAAFQLASGDNHPIHYDREYCRARGHRDMLAHGLQVAIQGAAGGGIFPHVVGDSLIAFLEQSSRFLKPVYCGDTLYPLLQVSELRPGRTTGVVVMKLTIHNQKGELVSDGEHKYLLKRRPA